MKKSRKHFNQHLEDEYYDDYIEPAEHSDKQSDLNNLFKLLSSQQDNKQPQNQAAKLKDSAPVQSSQTALKANNTINLTRLSQEMLSDLVAQLGKDAQNYVNVNNIATEVRPMEDYQLLETYYSLHKEFQTMPFIFYSYGYPKSFYVWQVNRLCPFKPASNALIVDTRAFGSQKSLHISLLLLGKITAEENETLLHVDVLDETHLLARLSCEKKIILKLYDIKNFSSIARVNPFKEEVLASHLYSYKGVLNFDNVREVNIWKRKTIQELDHEMSMNLQMEDANQDRVIEKEVLIKRQVLNEEFKPAEISKASIYKANNNVVILACKTISRIIAWRHDEFLTMSFDGEKTYSFRFIYNSLFLLYQDEDDFFSFFDDVEEKSFQEICFADFPAVTVTDGSDFYSPEIKSMREDAKRMDEARKTIKGSLSTTQGTPQQQVLVYNTAVTLTNPNVGASKIVKPQPNQDEEEETKASMLEKVIKTVNHIKHSQTEITELQQQKEILKQIRTEIKTRKTEIKNFNDKYKETEYYKNKDDKKPEEVPKEVMELYAQKKWEKKKIAREREKGKDIEKRRQAGKNEF